MKKLLIIAVFILCFIAGGLLTWKYHASTSAPVTEIAGWKNRPYNSEPLVSLDLPLVINIDKRNSGQFFVKSTDNSVMHRLRVSGKVISGAPVLRLEYNGQLSYTRCPDDNITFWLEPTEKVEVLIYADASSAYELHDIKLEACSECKSNEQLKQYLLQEIAGLREAYDQSDALQMAYLLLPWSARVSDWTSNLRARVDAPTFHFSSMSAAQIYYDVWEKDLSGAYCSGVASFYAKVLSLFGIHAFTVNAGLDAQMMTHVTTIVATQDNNTCHFYLFDPTYAGTFMRDGRFMDLSEVFMCFDIQTQTLSGTYWLYEKCVPRDRVVHDANGVVRVEKNQPYCFDNSVKGFINVARQRNSPLVGLFESYLANPQANMIVDMLRTEIYSIGNTDAVIRSQFMDLLRAQGSKLPGS